MEKGTGMDWMDKGKQKSEIREKRKRREERRRKGRRER